MIHSEWEKYFKNKTVPELEEIERSVGNILDEANEKHMKKILKEFSQIPFLQNILDMISSVKYVKLNKIQEVKQ